VVLCLRDLLEAAGRLRAPAGAAAVQTSARSQRNSRAPAGPLRAACVRPCSRGKQSALACQDCLACLAMAACLPCPGACPGLWLSCSCHVCEAHITRVWPESAPGAGASLPMRSQNCILIPVAAWLPGADSHSRGRRKERVGWVLGYTQSRSGASGARTRTACARIACAWCVSVLPAGAAHLLLLPQVAARDRRRARQDGARRRCRPQTKR